MKSSKLFTIVFILFVSIVSIVPAQAWMPGPEDGDDPYLPAPTPWSPTPTPITTPTTTNTPIGSDLDVTGDIEDLDTYTGNLITELGDFAKITDDYLGISLGSTGNNYIRSEIAGISISNFEDMGSMGVSAETGNHLYKYRLECQAYIVVYTTYSVSYYFDLSTVEREVQYFEMNPIDWGIPWTDPTTFDLSYNEYDITQKRSDIGGAFNLPLTASFDIPYSDAQYSLMGSTYNSVGIKTDIISIETDVEPAKTGVLSKVDPVYSSDSFTGDLAAEMDRFSDVQIISAAGDNDYNDAMAEVLASTSPGWKGESGDIHVTEDSHNTLGMSTTSRLATGSGETLTGNYQVNIGAELFYNKRNFEVRQCKYRYDKWWPGYSFTLEEASTVKDSRIVSVGVNNHYVKQKININVDVYTELEKLNVEITNPMEPELPTEFEEITFEDEWYGDMDTAVGGDVILPLGLSIGAWRAIIAAGIVLVVIVIAGFAVWFFYFHPVGRTLRRRWKKSRQARQREKED